MKIATFGIPDPSKYTLEIIQAFNSLIEKKKISDSVELHIVGGSTNTEYLSVLKKEALVHDRIFLHGHVSKEQYSHHLLSTQVAIQLRRFSNGETSAALMECLGHQIPTVANRIGSTLELPEGVCCFLRGDITPEVISVTLMELIIDETARKDLSENCASYIASRHSRETVQDSWRQFLSKTPYEPQKYRGDFFSSISRLSKALSNDVKIQITKTALLNFPPRRPNRVYLDITSTYRSDRNTGIENVVRNFFVQSQKILEPESWVIPVYLSSENGWKYSIADEWSIYNLNRLGITVVDSNEIDFHPGDSLVICDISSNLIDAYAEGLFNFLLLKRVKISGFIYDALPITQPQYFPTAVESVFHSWFQTMLQICQVVLTSSYSTKSEIESLLANVEGPFSEDQLRVEVDRYPSAIDCHEDCRSNYPPSESFKRKLNTGVCGLQFLMVGTIEPRKGHLEVLRIFEKLWNEGCKCTLSIVGKEGWVGLEDVQRKKVVEILSYIEALMEKHSAITWFSEAKDNDLCHLYNSADYLIAASFAEGYGLPLVEAQKHGLAVIARDIKVFREIADASTIFMDFTQLESGAKLLKDIMETPTPEVNFSTSYPGWDRYCRSVLGKITFK